MTLSDSQNSNSSDSFEYEASPEQLDQLMQVVKPKNWIPVLTIGGLMVTALIWSVVGRIPMTVTGQGILISPYSNRRAIAAHTTFRSFSVSKLENAQKQRKFRNCDHFSPPLIRINISDRACDCF